MSYRKNDLDGISRKLKMGITVLVLLVILVGTMLTGFEKVNTNKYGLDRSVFTGKVNTDRVYEAGMHYIGVGHEFIEFPIAQQTIKYYTSEDNSVTGRTQDGLAISLDISFQYQLTKESIIDIYKNHGTDYEGVFWQFARDVIRDVASLYTAIDFFNNRTSIGRAIEESMEAEFFSEFFEILVPAFQLLQIDLPDTFEDALERAEVARREIEIVQLQQQTALIEAETKILEAQAQYNVTLIEAQADADAFLTIINAQAEAVNITLTAERDAYYGLAQALNMTTTELLTYMWIQALTQIGDDGNLIIIGDNTPFINITPTE